jgi:hypothetical protein
MEILKVAVYLPDLLHDALLLTRGVLVLEMFLDGCIGVP